MRRSSRLFLLAACGVVASCAGPGARSVDDGPQEAAAQPSETVEAVEAVDASLVRPFEDDGRSQRERDLETVGRSVPPAGGD